jgi:sodium-dependent phosphate cotransporter
MGYEKRRALATWLAILALGYLLLVGVTVIGDGFKWISGGAGGAERIFSFASNPVVGVILGTLATALVQSSSTVTSVIVGLVAGGVPIGVAIPMILGANMGTTITNTIVSLGNIKQRDAFARSFQAAVVHDFFNLYCIFFFLPIESVFHPLENTAGAVAQWFAGGANASLKDFNIIGLLIDPVADAAMSALKFISAPYGAILAIVIGIGFIMGSVMYLGVLLRQTMNRKAKRFVDSAIGRNPIVGVASGTLVTVLVQSSSTTTSLIVPLAGARVVSLAQVFPFTMGANIGTCITALLAATAITGDMQVLALHIALVHLFYNTSGVVLFLVVPWLRRLPIQSAEWLGRKTEHNRIWVFVYIATFFFLIPALVLSGQAVFQQKAPSVVEARSHEQELNRAEEQVKRADIHLD